MKRRSFLVTGAAGFIGYHLARRLLEEGHQVTGIDGMTPYYDTDLKAARLERLSGFAEFRFIEAMLENADAWCGFVEEQRFDAIVHLAAQAGVRYSIEAPRTYVDSNLIGTYNVLEYARTARPAHLLVASTSSVYGMSDKDAFQETDETRRPVSFYAATKVACEAMAHSYAHLFGIPTTAFRFFTVYGPWGRPDMALFKFTDAILQERPIDVYGEGKQERDFTYVGDLVEAMVRLVDRAPDCAAGPVGAADTLSPVAPYRVVNIAGGAPVSLMDFIETLEAALDRKAIRNMMQMQPGDVRRTSASPALLEELTGYRPATPLKKGVEEFVTWYRSYRSTA